MASISRAEARRRAAAIRNIIATDEPLITGDNLQRLLEFRSQVAEPGHTEVVTQAVVAVCGRATHIRGTASFVRCLSDVSVYASWAAREGRNLDWRALMDHTVIHDFARSAHPNVSERSHAQRVVRLRTLASVTNPGPTAPPQVVASKHTAVKPLYTDVEDRALIRWAKGQNRPQRARKLQLLLGLSRGAGASAADLRKVRGNDISDQGDAAGIDVTLGEGATRRTVPVRRAYEPLVRAGLLDAPRSGLLFGSGKNAINRLISDADNLSTDVPHFEVARARTSWLAELMTLPIPLSTLMAAAGLQSARVRGRVRGGSPSRDAARP